MKINNMTKYSLNGAFKAYLIFAAIIFAIIHLIVIIDVATSSQGGTFGGIDSSTIFFMFILGLVVYREDLSMAIQNGVSRKSYFCSAVIVFTLLAVIGSVGDTLMSMLGNFYQSNVTTGVNFDSSYEQFFMSSGNMNVSPIPKAFDYFKEFILQISINVTALAGGLLLTSVTYRLPKAFKFIIPTVIFVLIFIAFPIIDYSVFNLAITKSFIRLVEWMWESVWHMSSIFFGLAALLFAISYLFIRRVQITDRK